MSFPPPSPKQARMIWVSLTALAVGVLIGLVVVMLWAVGLVMQQLTSVLLPLGIAAVIACLLDPLVDFLESRRLPRARAIICVFALAFMTAAALIGSVLPQIVEESRQLAERIPSYSLRLQQRIRAWAAHPPARLRSFLSLPGISGTATNRVVAPATNDVSLDDTNAPALSSTSGDEAFAWSGAFDPKTVKSITVWLASALPKLGSWLLGQVTRVASWFGVLAGLILIPIYAFYLLLEKRGISRNWTDYLPLTDSDAKNEMIFVLSSINDCLVAFFRGQVLVAICDGVLYTIGFLSIGLPYAFLLGALAIVLTMVPFLGAIVICVLALIIASVQFGDWLHPVLVLSVFGVVQMIEGFVISPKIMGGRVGLHPLTIIIGVMVGTSLMGNILGGILAIPLTAALRALMVRYVWKLRAGTR